MADKPYHKENFKYDKQNDQVICPQGKILKYHHCTKNDRNAYKIYRATDCQNCPVKELCTKGKARSVGIEDREHLRQKMRQRLKSEQGKIMYKKRLHPIEAIFGHLKFNLGYTHFLLRGLEKVQAEFKLMCLAYNLRKLMTFCSFFAIFSINNHPVDESKLLNPICQRTPFFKGKIFTY